MGTVRSGLRFWVLGSFGLGKRGEGKVRQGEAKGGEDKVDGRMSLTAWLCTHARKWLNVVLSRVHVQTRAMQGCACIEYMTL